MNIHTMTSPVLVKDWLTSEFGVTLPHDPTTVKDLNMTADGDLLILLEGSTILVRGDFDETSLPAELVLSGTTANDVVTEFVRDDGVQATINGTTTNYPLPADGAAIALDFTQGGNNRIALFVQTACQTITLRDGAGNARVTVNAAHADRRRPSAHGTRLPAAVRFRQPSGSTGRFSRPAD